jgi:hypothetical protein
MPKSSKRRTTARRTRSQGSARSQRAHPGTKRSRKAKGRTNGRKTRSSPQIKARPKYSRWIDTPDEHEQRTGQSFATRNHDVIRQWAQTRKAAPCIVEGTTRRNSSGILPMDFPGYGGKNLKKVSWNEWFETFDKSKLVFVFQEHTTDGSTSNFFKLNSSSD